ncbi:hypothetical protein [Endozoicomonas sp. YOMI1]|uniref:hypothetical protein n=1 Tax=Endozoicomonas sp. YOMI1 TaxID=2828739 RepID=UPI00214833F0|nr:hypothetical protein [Endozoicomonas sp. YOMI1]
MNIGALGPFGKTLSATETMQKDHWKIMGQQQVRHCLLHLTLMRMIFKKQVSLQRGTDKLNFILSSVAVFIGWSIDAKCTIVGYLINIIVLFWLVIPAPPPDNTQRKAVNNINRHSFNGDCWRVNDGIAVFLGLDSLPGRSHRLPAEPVVYCW